MKASWPKAVLRRWALSRCGRAREGRGADGPAGGGSGCGVRVLWPRRRLAASRGPWASGAVLGCRDGPRLPVCRRPLSRRRGDAQAAEAWLNCCASPADMQYDEDDDEITPDLWQEACWIVIR